jgi:hypothetical protein
VDPAGLQRRPPEKPPRAGRSARHSPGAWLEKILAAGGLKMNGVPCTSQPEAACAGCDLAGRLMCRYDWRDSMVFFMAALPFFFTAIAGVILGGYGLWLPVWLAYALFFFIVWEGRVLCSHCPYWAEDGRILRCHANYGVLKIWRYRPGPMSRWERIQFVAGALLLIAFPLPLLLAAQAYLPAAVCLVSAGSACYLVYRNACTRCVNFSCLFNAVPAQTRADFFRRNPTIARAWGKGEK